MQKLFLLQLYPAKERASNAFWCSETESNCRHGDFQSPALPTELSGQTLTGSCEPVKDGDAEGARTLDLQRDRLAF